jgi:hypothetical protein
MRHSAQTVGSTAPLHTAQSDSAGGPLYRPQVVSNMSIHTAKAASSLNSLSVSGKKVSEKQRSEIPLAFGMTALDWPPPR